MMTPQRDRAILERYGVLLQYPNARSLSLAATLLGVVQSNAPEAAECLSAFLAEGRPLSLESLQEHYTRAFDLAPQAVPYLSVYLFGAESTQRGQFMAGLSLSYALQGLDPGKELPDHVSLVLRYAPLAPEEEWNELRQWCLPPPVKQMARDLEKAQNPYRHVLNALVAFLAMPVLGEAAHV